VTFNLGALHTAAEWQAIWAFATFLVAFFGAGLALVQLRQNGKALIEQSRPAIVVDFHFRSTLVSIEVRNSGLTAARDVKLRWSAVPVISEPRRNDAFNLRLVKNAIPFLSAGRSIRYVVGVFAQYPDDAPRTFTVKADYVGPDGKRRWSSTSVLDLDQWAQALADNDYANKNWNEMTRQTKAQQSGAEAMKRTADSIETLAEFVELQPSMKVLRAEEEAEEAAWRRQFEGTPPDVAEVQPAEESGDQQTPT
jgi:hypothetical protein